MIGQSLGPSFAQSNAWLRSGAYVKFTSSLVPRCRISFPNGTKAIFRHINAPSVLQWRVLDVTGRTAHLNVTLRIEGKVTVFDSEEESDVDGFTYRKTLLVDMNTETRESFIGGKSIGKLCFWTEVPVILGQTIALTSPPSDALDGNVTGFRSINMIGRRIESYEVEVFQFSPFIRELLAFDKQTGIALTYTLHGLFEIIPGSVHTYTLGNGTVYNITSYAKTKLAEELWVEGTYTLTLDDTNVDLGQRLQLIPKEVYIVIFLGLFISLAAMFIAFDRTRQAKSKSSKQKKDKSSLQQKITSKEKIAPLRCGKRMLQCAKSFISFRWI